MSAMSLFILIRKIMKFTLNVKIIQNIALKNLTPGRIKKECIIICLIIFYIIILI